MSFKIEEHIVEETDPDNPINFECSLCGLESNLKSTFRRESCNE